MPVTDPGVQSEVVGVDFGTATTLVAQAGGAGAVVVPIGRVTTAMPSAVVLTGDARPAGAGGPGLRAGEDAEAASPDQVIRSVKRAITQRSEQLVLPARNGSGPAVAVSVDEAVAAVLREAVARARAAGLALNGSGTVRLGCPATWDGAQRRRLVGIAARAGLAVDGSTLVEEPVAAGVAWLTHRYLVAGGRPSGTMLVVDMGGGTLDVAVLRVTGGPRPEVAVLSCLGTTSAGDALDAAIARDIAGEFGVREIDPALGPEVTWALLERAAREAKVRLSRVDEHPIVLPRQLAALGSGAQLAESGWPEPVRYHRRRLEGLFASQVDGVDGVVLSALRLARLASGPGPAPATTSTGAALRALPASELAAGVDFVLLVGGMSRVPYLSARLAALLPSARVLDDLGVAPEEAVAAGLADPLGYQGLRLHRPPFDLVLDTAAGRVVVYEAYTPLVEPWQIYSGQSELGFDRWVRPPDVPDRGMATLRAVTAAGEPLWLTVDGRRVDGLPVPLGTAGVGLGLTCDGGLAIVDGTGAALVLATDGWPVPTRDRTGPVLRRLAPARL